MTKVILVGINARFIHPNLAIRYLRNYIARQPYRIVLKEFTINQSRLSIMQEIYDENPKIIGISVYVWNAELVHSLLPVLKIILPDVIIVLGGPEVSYTAAAWLQRHPEVDYIVCGAGEAGFLELAVNNFHLSSRVISKTNPPFPAIPFPYLEEDFPELTNRFIYYETSRGCPFRCPYCLSAREDQPLEMLPLERVKKELAYLMAKDPRIIKFIDRTFNADPVRARAIWNYISSVEKASCFHFEIRPELLKDADIELLGKKTSHAFRLEIGIQSVNLLTRRKIGREKLDSGIVTKMKKLSTLPHIIIHTDLIVGLPHENLDSIKKSFNEVYKMQPRELQLGFLKVLPGSPLENYTNKFEIKNNPAPPYEILQNRWLSFREICALHAMENLFNYYYNSGKFRTILENAVNWFETPFSFYWEFETFHRAGTESSSNTDWKSRALLLLNFLMDKYPGKKDFCMDCLRWDWCLLAVSHYYPPFLRPADEKDLKITGTAYLKEKIAENELFLDEYRQTGKLLNRTIYYRADSSEFRKKYLPGHTLAAFIKIGKKTYPIMLA